MLTRHRPTEAIEYRLDRAREHLAASRRQIDAGRPVWALFNVMHAILNLQEARKTLDDNRD